MSYFVNKFFKFKNEMSDKQLTRANKTDAGSDICSSVDFTIPARGDFLVNTDLYIAIPDGYVAIVKSRSGLSVKKKIEVGAGVIDSGYTGEILVHLYNHSDEDVSFNKGDRIAQLLVMKIEMDEFVEREIVRHTERGNKGIGSSGVK